jgi:hypothetical protein
MFTLILQYTSLAFHSVQMYRLTCYCIVSMKSNDNYWKLRDTTRFTDAYTADQSSEMEKKWQISDHLTFTQRGRNKGWPLFFFKSYAILLTVITIQSGYEADRVWVQWRNKVDSWFVNDERVVEALRSM